MSRRFFELILLITIGLALPLAVWLTLPQPQASAQCGKTASSCKTCHETQGKLRVNTKGEWHTQHAFGDFCVYCHAGNAQAKDNAKAHTGLVKPMADVTCTCATCHTDDCNSRAQKYASVSGVTVGQGSSGPTSPKGPAPLIPLVPRAAGTGDTPTLLGQATSYGNESLPGLWNLSSVLAALVFIEFTLFLFYLLERIIGQRKDKMVG